MKFPKFRAPPEVEDAPRRIICRMLGRKKEVIHQQLVRMESYGRLCLISGNFPDTTHRARSTYIRHFVLRKILKIVESEQVSLSVLQESKKLRIALR